MQPLPQPKLPGFTGQNNRIGGAPPAARPPIIPDIDREAVVKAINDAGLLTYDVRRVRITGYLKSMYALARFLTQTRIDMDAKETVISDIVEKIHEHLPF